MILLTAVLLVILPGRAQQKSQTDIQKTIKVLAIGNSFSEDAVEQNLHEIAAADGVTMIVGNLYIGGCSIDRHVQNIQKDAAAYAYRKVNAKGVKTSTKDTPLSKAIVDEKWDYVSVQQVSGLSGQLQSYGSLPVLVKWVREKAPQAHLLFHQTWAYASDSKHADFKRYDNSQQQMTGAIRYATTQAANNVGITTIVPSLKAIYYARQSMPESDITRDGYHLNKRFARYIAAATWYATISGKPVSGNTYCPENMTAEELQIAQQAADWAVFGPQLAKRKIQVLKPQNRRGIYRRCKNGGKSISVLGGTHAADSLSVLAKQMWANSLHSKVTSYAVEGAGLAQGQGYDLQRQADEARVSDIYVLWLSNEDYLWCQLLGDTASYSAKDGYSAKSRLTQCGGLNYCIQKLREKNPKATIYVFAPLDDSNGVNGTLISTKRNAVGYSMAESIQVLKKCCARQGVRVLNQVVLDMHPTNEVCTCYQSDGVRLTETAYKKVAPTQARFLSGE